MDTCAPALLLAKRTLWQVAQDLFCWRPVVRIFADVRPDDAPTWVNDKYRWRRHAVAQQVEHAIGVRHGMIGIGQNRKTCIDELGHRLSTRRVLIGYGQDLGLALLELRIR